MRLLAYYPLKPFLELEIFLTVMPVLKKNFLTVCIWLKIEMCRYMFQDVLVNKKI